MVFAVPTKSDRLSIPDYQRMAIQLVDLLRQDLAWIINGKPENPEERILDAAVFENGPPRISSFSTDDIPVTPEKEKQNREKADIVWTLPILTDNGTLEGSIHKSPSLPDFRSLELSGSVGLTYSHSKQM